MKRSDAKETALNVVLVAYRDECYEITRRYKETSHQVGLAAAHAAARRRAVDSIYTIMRKTQPTASAER